MVKALHLRGLVHGRAVRRELHHMQLPNPSEPRASGETHEVPSYVIEPGPTGIRLEASHPIGTIVLPGVRLTIDGQPVPGINWGSSVIPVVPGRHVVTAAPGGLGRIPARATIEVRSGHLTHVFYRSPLLRRGPRHLCIGTLGPLPPQEGDTRWTLRRVSVPLGIMLFAASIAVLLIFVARSGG